MLPESDFGLGAGGGEEIDDDVIAATDVVDVGGAKQDFGVLDEVSVFGELNGCSPSDVVMVGDEALILLFIKGIVPISLPPDVLLLLPLPLSFSQSDPTPSLLVAVSLCSLSESPMSTTSFRSTSIESSSMSMTSSGEENNLLLADLINSSDTGIRSLLDATVGDGNDCFKEFNMSTSSLVCLGDCLEVKSIRFRCGELDEDKTEHCLIASNEELWESLPPVPPLVTLVLDGEQPGDDVTGLVSNVFVDIRNTRLPLDLCC